MSNKRNHGDESNRAPYIEQPRKLVCNKMTPTDKAEKHMHPPPADAAAAPSIPDELRPEPPDPQRTPRPYLPPKSAGLT